MSKPHVCPVCEGKGYRDPVPTLMNAPTNITCPACKGACVLWEPERQTDERRAQESERARHRYPADQGPDFNVKASKEAMDDIPSDRPPESHPNDNPHFCTVCAFLAVEAADKRTLEIVAKLQADKAPGFREAAAQIRLSYLK